MSLKCTMILGDCLEVMPTLANSSVQASFCDLPYQVSACAWDKKLDLQKLWSGLGRISKAGSVQLFTATNPFASDLIVSNRQGFRYDLVWEKKKPTGFFNSKRAPLRAHEIILVFGGQGLFIPQMTAGKRYMTTTKLSRGTFYGSRKPYNLNTEIRGLLRYPRSVQSFDESDIRTSGLNGQTTRRYHAAQKPVALLKWLISSYAGAGDIVFDPTSGSGTTAVAAMLSGRSSICIEKNQGYFDASVDRVMQTAKRNLIDVKIEVIT